MRLSVFKISIIILISIVMLILFYHFQQRTKLVPTPHNVTLHFGQQGVEDFTVYTGGKVDVQPAGMSFYELVWTPPDLGKVNIDHNKHSLTIENVFSVLGSKFVEQNSDGINGIDIDAGLNKAEFVEPKQAYLAYKELLTQINQKGWHQYYSHSQPRISKVDNLRSIKEFNEVVDPSYILSYEEWRDIFKNKVYYRLYYTLFLDGVIMNMTIKKTGTNDFGMEQYMIRLSFDTAEYIGRNLIENGFKIEGKDLEIANIQLVMQSTKDRNRQELDLRDKGYEIDESYETPDFWQYMK